jgi:hypothetical protein
MPLRLLRPPQHQKLIPHLKERPPEHLKAVLVVKEKVGKAGKVRAD